MCRSVSNALGVLAVVGALVGCGGGGGGGGGSPAPPPPPDSTPDPFSFAERTNAVRGAATESAPIALAGINVATAISIAGGEYSVDGAAYTSSGGAVVNGATITVRVTAATTPGASVEAVITIGGVAATFRATTSIDVTAPTAAVVFPPRYARTSGAAITVRGTAADASGSLAAVRVNGVLATTIDGFANWTVVVPLDPGANTLVVTAEDGYLNVANAAAEVVVQRNARFGTPRSLALDAANGRAFVVDASADAVFAVDLVTGVRTWFAETAAPNFARKDAAPVAIVHDQQRDRLLVLDNFEEAIVAINMTTKERSILSGRSTSSVNRFQSPTDLALDSARNRLLVTSNSPAAVIAVDLDSGARIVLSDATTPDAANMFAFPRAMALDAAHNRVLVTDTSNNTIYAVDLITGARTALSSNTIPNAVELFDAVTAIEVDVGGNRALVPQFYGRVLAVDLTSGQRSVFSAGTGLGPDQLIFDPTDLAIDGAGDRVLALDGSVRGVAAIDLVTGAQTLVSSNNAASGGIGLVQPVGMALDLSNARAFVTDQFANGVVSIDLATAVGTTVLEGGTGNPQFAAAGALVLDAALNRLFILQTGQVVGFPPAVVAVDLGTDTRTMLSGPTQPDAGLPLTTPEQMALDGQRMRLLVTERDDRLVKAIDLATGARTIVSSNTVPNGTNPFLAPLGIVVDAANDRALIASSGFGPGSSVLAMSLATGARSVVGTGNLTGPSLVALDVARNRALVADLNRQSLFAADLTTGVITSVTAEDDADNPIDTPYALGYDAASQIAYLVEGNFAGVLAIDLVTGRRAYLSR